VSVVGYEGNALYLGRWRQAVQSECDKRGWTFVINPPDLRACDVLVAFRDGPWDGWMCDAWKSGVKAVNAIAAGRPLITQGTVAALEVQPVCWLVKDQRGLTDSFDYWASFDWRATAASECLRRVHEFTLSTVAMRYRNILEGVVKEKAA